MNSLGKTRQIAFIIVLLFLMLMFFAVGKGLWALGILIVGWYFLGQAKRVNEEK